MSRLSDATGRLYRGEVSYDFVSRWRRWYTISGIVLLISVGALFVRGLDLGIEFKGGAVFLVPTSTGTVAQAQTAVKDAGVNGEVVVTEVTSKSGRSLRIQTPSLANGQAITIRNDLATKFTVPQDQISTQVVGPSWGQQITKKAIRGLVIFIVLVVIFLTLYFEWKMAIAAVIALIHDLLITVGIYALTGFTVTPATVIGVLTILGYSLYDTVVVFDKVKENSRGLTSGSRMTYSESANLALNQTLVRSINTSIIALLPVASILFVGSGLLGAGTLKDLSLALFIGLAAGTYSSIFIAVPLLTQMKEREPAMQALARRVEARRSAGKVPAGVVSSTRPSSASRPAAQEAAVVDPAPVAAQAPAPRPNPPAQAGQRNQPRRGGQRRPPGKKRR
ncbi:MAG TPA: protein translocase subunit SecF [Actinomycetes bacterium]|nr:protein translocase subunit SecF [Actinomycetes bacterium]